VNYFGGSSDPGLLTNISPVLLFILTVTSLPAYISLVLIGLHLITTFTVSEFYPVVFKDILFTI
jgi:hypothetical protein